MRRRRNPRRPLRPGTPGLAGGPLRQLNRAHHLLENGQNTDAAFIFERLARGAHDRGFLRHVPHLYLQAARGHLLAGNPEAGKSLILESLNVFAVEKRWLALERAGRRAIDELQQLGYNHIAEEIHHWLAKNLPKPFESNSAPPESNPMLPIKCPFCGGVLRPGEIEMLDPLTGECPYCGSAVRGGE